MATCFSSIRLAELTRPPTRAPSLYPLRLIPNGSRLCSRPNIRSPILHGLLLLHAAAEMEDLPRDPLMDLLSSSGRLPATLLRLLRGPRSPSLNIRKDSHNTRPGSRHGRLCFVAGRRSNGAGRAEKSGAPSQPPIGERTSTPCFSPTSRGEEVRFWQLLKNFWYWGTDC